VAGSEHDVLRERLARIVLKMISLAIIALVAAVAAIFLVPGALGVRALAASLIVAVTVALEWRWRRHAMASIRYIELGLQQRESAAQSQATSDQAAREVIANYDATGQPYALYLRSFDIEVIVRGSLEASAPSSGEFEAALAAGLEGRVAILGIQNPADNRPYRTDVIRKFALPSKGWREGFEQLVAGADFIVTVPVALTPGVSAELAGIRELRRETDTVVIVPGTTGDQVTENIELTRAITRARIPSSQRLAVTSPELASFPRVAFEENVDFDALDSHPMFADLLERVAFLTALPPDDRRQARDARLARDEAIRTARLGGHLDLLRRLQIAYRVQERLGDRVGLIATLYAIGGVRYHADDLAGATEALQDGVARCGDRDIVRSGSILLLLGVCQHEAGDLGGAAGTLSRAVEALTAAGSREELAEALISLGEVFLTRGEPEHAIDPLARATTLKREGRDDAGLARALVEAGSALVGAGREPEAITALTESLELTRAAHGDPALTEREPLILAALTVACGRMGADMDAQRYAAAARALPVSPEYASLVENILASVEAGGHAPEANPLDTARSRSTPRSSKAGTSVPQSNDL
jgi:tetratricopeptide (TPR) repeat protein